MPRGQDEGREFEVYIEFAKDGRQLREFDIEHMPASGTAPPYTSLFVEGEPSEEFRIIVRSLFPSKRKGDNEVMATVYIDGRKPERVADRLMFLGYTEHFVVSDINIERNGKAITYPLVFSVPDTVTDPRDAQVAPSDAAHVGSIIIELDYGSSRGDRGRAFPAPVVKELGTMGAGKARRGKAAENAQKHKNASIFTPRDDAPFYEYRIKYATRVIIDQHLEKKRRSSGYDAMPPTPRSLASPSVQPPSSAGPSTQKSKKRSRPVSVAASPSSDSSSSSSSSDESEAAAPVGPAAMMEMFQLFMQTQEAARSERRKAKEAKKVKKDEKKRRKREEKAKRRESKKLRIVDLTGDTDDEDAPVSTQRTKEEPYIAVKAEPRV